MKINLYEAVMERKINKLENTVKKLENLAIKGFKTRMEDYIRLECIYFHQLNNKIISEKMYNRKMQKVESEKNQMIQEYKELGLINF